MVIKLNFPTIPFELKDYSFYHKHYTPYCFDDNEIINSVESQWQSQKIAHKLNIAPDIFSKEYHEGIIYTVMEKINSNNIDIICGNKNIDFALSKKYEIIQSLEKLHENGILHGDVLTSACIYTNQIHNIYYDTEKGIGFIDFGESRYIGEGIGDEEFKKWQMIEMELDKEKLFTKISKEEMEYYISVEKMLQYNYITNINNSI